MGKRKRKKPEGSSTELSVQVGRASLPEELEARLLAVWQNLGHLIEWCDSSTSWIKMFCTEVRPYRETFYRRAVAKMLSDYSLDRPTASLEMALTECLIATQCASTPDDSEIITCFRETWRESLRSSTKEIELFIRSDLDLR